MFTGLGRLHASHKADDFFSLSLVSLSHVQSYSSGYAFPIIELIEKALLIGTCAGVL
jgi:hypothetical protein